MSARRNKSRVSRLFHGRFHGRLVWRWAGDIDWDNMAPVGREFGSPDYERLMEEDRMRDLSVQSLKGMFAASVGQSVSIEDMNPSGKLRFELSDDAGDGSPRPTDI